MQLQEQILDKNRLQPPSDSNLSLRQFDDSNVSSEMAELLDHLRACESLAELRMVLSIYVPGLNDGAEV